MTSAWPEAVKRIKASGANVFVDVSAMMDISWTGIANVTANLAREVNRVLPRNSFFFHGDMVIDPGALMTAIDHAPGAYLEVLLDNGFAQLGSIGHFIGCSPISVGVFPNIKTAHRFFDIEAVVFHDLSAILMPELHQDWAAFIHCKALSRDAKTSDIVCCVSSATEQDAQIYLGLDPSRTIVSHLGVRPPAGAEPAKRKNYAVVLGTIEPRKNLRLVSEFMLARPDLAGKVALVFVGRRGWGQAFDEIFGELTTNSPWKNGIFFTDFVSEAEKWALLRNARFAIFPSLHEGFGLPVVECMAAGCPIIVGRSSSLMEFGLPSELYFDPFSLIDFSRAFRVVEGLAEAEAEALAQKLRDKATTYTWEAFSGRILNAIAKRLPEVEKNMFVAFPSEGVRVTSGEVKRA